MLQLRNPGIVTVALFALVAGLVVFLVHVGSSLTEASKLAVELLTLVGAASAAFAGKSAIVIDHSKRPSSRPPPLEAPREKLVTWPEVPVRKPETVEQRKANPMLQTWPAQRARLPRINAEEDEITDTQRAADTRREP